LALRSDPAIQRERNLISRSLDATTAYGEAAIPSLQQLYAQEPDYRDVADRLQQSYVAYGDTLVAQSQWCVAAEQFRAAADITITPGLIAKRDENQERCTANAGVTQSLTQTGSALVTRSGETPIDGTPLPTEPAAYTSNFAGRGHLLYSARDASSGANHVYLYTIGDSSLPRILREAAAQPAFRPDGQRLAFRNLRSDSLGLSALDPATGLTLQFTKFSEDSQPSWNPQGNKLVFASNREGDRLWRIYVTWAEAEAEVSNLSFGETPHWHPLLDQIVFKGCDTTGNNCGLWSMNSTGSQRAPLTTVQRDTHPTWSPDGSSVVFMSDGRDGNMEIYALQVSSGETVRLTNSPAADVLPAVSPDGQWVAFLSNREGAWKFWAVPIEGGATTLLASLNGDLGNWQDQGLVWLR
jgi:Tol biopolymer transport system component